MTEGACIQPITSYQTAGIRKRCSVPQIATPLVSVGQTFVTRTAGYLVEIVLHLKIFYTGTSSFSVASIASWVYKGVTCLYFCYICEQVEHPPHHHMACQDDKSLSKRARNRLGASGAPASPRSRSPCSFPIRDDATSDIGRLLASSSSQRSRNLALETGRLVLTTATQRPPTATDSMHAGLG
jgi:hypothetical protein